MMLQCTDNFILQSTVEFLMKRSSCLNLSVLLFLSNTLDVHCFNKQIYIYSIEK